MVRLNILAVSVEELPAVPRESLSQIYKEFGLLLTVRSVELRSQQKQYVWDLCKSRLKEITKVHKSIREQAQKVCDLCAYRLCPETSEVGLPRFLFMQEEKWLKKSIRHR